jgi:hypothetical protein
MAMSRLKPTSPAAHMRSNARHVTAITAFETVFALVAVELRAAIFAVRGGDAARAIRSLTAAAHALDDASHCHAHAGPAARHGPHGGCALSGEDQGYPAVQVPARKVTARISRGSIRCILQQPQPHSALDGRTPDQAYFTALPVRVAA